MKNNPIEFLRSALATGPVPVAELQPLAVAAGLLPEGKLISQSKAFRRARDILGVTSQHDGFGRGSCWSWALPPPDQSLPQATTSAGEGTNMPKDVVPAPTEAKPVPAEAEPRASMDAAQQEPLAEPSRLRTELEKALRQAAQPGQTIIISIPRYAEQFRCTRGEIMAELENLAADRKIKISQPAPENSEAR